MAKELVNTLFTQENCKNCEKGIWEKINCNGAIKHTAKILNEKHEHYVCSIECEIPGHKTEIYKL